MDSEELDRLLQVELSWFESAHACLGEGARPLSLLSAQALRVMNLTWLEGGELDLEQEARELAVYAWLHTAPVAEVKAALWDSTWRQIWLHAPDAPDIVRAALRAQRARLTAMVVAVSTTERAKPRKGKDDTPRDVVRPSLLTNRLTTVARATGLSLEHCGWELPLVQALQIYHAVRWNDGLWTVRPGREVKPEEVADVGPEWLKGEAKDLG